MELLAILTGLIIGFVTGMFVSSVRKDKNL
jgi:uncharacterized protein YneF (UPF0154 family)